MKTNFTIQRFLVLTNEDDKVIAIINCPAGEINISEKVEQAIRDEFDASEVVINAVLINGIETLENVSEYDFNLEIKAEITCHHFEPDTEKFTLTRTEVY